MKVRDVESGFLLRLEKGEKVLSTLVDFCSRRGIEGGFLWGLGAVNNAELGYYSLEKKEYYFKTLVEDREVASMTGNIALVDGRPIIHAHVVLSACDETLACVGAHLKEAEVAVTLEVYLAPFPTAVLRVMDNDIGLKLLDL